MTPIQAEVIKRKLAVIVQNLRALESVVGLAVEEFKAIEDYLKRPA